MKEENKMKDKLEELFKKIDEDLEMDDELRKAKLQLIKKLIENQNKIANGDWIKKEV
jgi:hypothetical protein